MKVTNFSQPLFEVGDNCFLPPEFCTIDGVPDCIRSNPMLMRNVLASCRKNPEEKQGEIQKFCTTLFKQKTLKDWGVTIDVNPVSLETNVLPTPMITLHNGKSEVCDTNILRRLAIQKAEMLKKGTWVVAYSTKNYRLAEDLKSQLQQSSQILEMNVEEPEWIELPREDDYERFEKELRGYINQCGEP